MSVLTVHNRFEKKVVRRTRFGITRGQALLFLISFSLFFYLLTELVFASGVEVAPPVKEITVRAGDSLWKLAVRYQEEAKMDVNELVAAIKEINDMEGVMIYPGQTLRIPLPE
ncbi:cell division suppressor protein YneA [Brevibacillus choshinensis]|uniref:LysM peptidoglycan-binding domain-containing protein n=1 Tax=Brevibacillus choshinensis TaxID=54911 RepID=A0ABX7FI57_BRECH|nr:LysM peptidoglycan-binding domain-containing protein [Brevibacillus choshinensis]QRG65382.1 LysM peptidoglycan-binding domain-containing protein [Brevibacillus choshinensis]